MKFKITRHSSGYPPDDALDLLTLRMGKRRDDVQFNHVGREIRANFNRDEPIAMTSDDRSEVGRLTVLGIVEQVCDRAPELELDWYAVSPAR